MSALVGTLRLLFLGSLASSLAAQERVTFEIVTIEESGTARRSISRTEVDGPTGTDIDIVLDASPLRMTARFVTDPIDADTLRVRTDIETRRFYGLSERDLPLYEEDRQREIFELGFDERLVLLPFGAGGDAQLKIEITPSRSTRSSTLPNGKPRPIEIDLEQPSPAGVIQVRAHKVPHLYSVRAELRHSHQVVSSGQDRVRIGEEGVVSLAPAKGDRGIPLAVAITVADDTRGESSVEFRFDVRRGDGAPLASSWAGISTPGSTARYRLQIPDATGQSRAYELGLTLEPVTDSRPPR